MITTSLRGASPNVKGINPEENWQLIAIRGNRFSSIANMTCAKKERDKDVFGQQHFQRKPNKWLWKQDTCTAISNEIIPKDNYFVSMLQYSIWKQPFRNAKEIRSALLTCTKFFFNYVWTSHSGFEIGGHFEIHLIMSRICNCHSLAAKIVKEGN